MTVTLRFFAAARAAAGTGRLAVAPSETIAETLATVPGVTALGTSAAEFAAVIARCSFLLNGVTAPASSVVVAGDSIDVLPPFAGG